MRNGAIIGYARVSSKNQNLERQIKDLNEYGCERVFTEKKSAKDFERPVYQELKSKLRFGDVLVVHDLSRFGRNDEEIMSEWKSIVDADIDIVVLDMPILNTLQYRHIEGIGKLISDIFLQVMAWMVDKNRQDIKKAQREGIALAKEKGVYKGRPIKYRADAKNPKDRMIYDQIVLRLKQNQSVMDIHRYTGVSRVTIYRIKKELAKNSDPSN